MFATRSEAEKLFLEDVREKKKAASGVHSKTGKNGYVGTMRFPSDIMSRKDKMRYRRSSKVMTTNLYEEIITADELEQLEDFEQRNRLQYWRTQYTLKEILSGLQSSSKRYYDIVKRLDLPKAPRTNQKATKRTGSIKTKAQPKTAEIKPTEPKQEVKEIKAPAVVEEPVQQVIVNGLNVIFNGTYSAEKIEKQLTKFMLLLDGEEEDFYIEFRLMQREKAAQK